MTEEFAPVDIKEVEKKLEKMKIKDLEISGGRELNPIFTQIMVAFGLMVSLFHIWVLTMRPIDPWYFRTLHVVLGGILVFVYVPARGSYKGRTTRRACWITSSCSCSLPP